MSELPTPAPAPAGGVASSARPLCVLSTGRSGSSLLARVLNLMGVDLGPEDDLLAANDYNPSGFWENTRISNLNDEILAKRGGTWLAPPPPQPGWEEDQAFDGLRERASSLIRETFTGGRWGFKDPRAVLTLPLWRQVVGEMDYIICARPASEVVASLLRNMPGEDGRRFVQWWLDVNALALAETVGERRHVVLFDGWFSDVDATARHVGAFVHGDADAISADGYAEIAGFFDPALRKVSADAQAHESAPEVGAMYALLELVAAQEPGASVEDQRRVAAVAEALAEAHRQRALSENERVARVAVEREHAELVGALREAAAEREGFARVRAELDASLRHAQAYVHDLEAYRDVLIAERDDARAVLARRDGELAGSQRELAGVQRQLGDTQEALAALQRSVSWRATAPLRAVKRRLRR